MGVVLAGGEGRRFRPLTYYIPKPMVPVGKTERPLLEHIILWLSRGGLKEIIVLVGYRWRQIVNYFADGSRFGVNMRYVVDKPPYFGTGGALRRALDEGVLEESKVALVWYGDILAPVSVSDLLRRHREEGADATLVVSNKYRVPVGVARLGKDMRIVTIEEKPEMEVNVNVGIMALRVDSVKRAMKSASLGYSFDIVGHLLPTMIKAGMKVRAIIYEGPWYDVGSSERYEKLDHEHVEEIMGLDCDVPPYVHL
ncbi:MAG: nucleotidyltransferase family protein [Acidilobaceae archaeon]|nr:nucleotidyltransferase family protein [Acidilobaceae archaeon]